MTHGLELIPIIPILLLPFIIIFFIIIFPIWGVALGVLGLTLVIVRSAEWMLRKAGVEIGAGLSTPLHRAFRWVLTFGGWAVSAPDQPDERSLSERRQ